jgi:spore coat protein U-like protein
MSLGAGRAWRGGWLALALLLLLGIASAPRPAQAQGCFVNGAFGMNFGTVTSAGRATTSSLNFTCAPDFGNSALTYYYQICIFIGPGDFSAGQPTRRMSNYNGAYLLYDLFADPALSQLIGAPGSLPVYKVYTAVPPNVTRTVNTPVYGWVYPGQSVPAGIGFQEQSLPGQLRWRYSTSAFPQSAACSSGGNGGGSVHFDSSGVLASFENSCAIISTELDFGRITPPLNPVRGTANIRVHCPVGTAWKLGLDDGLHFDGSMRRMAGSGGFVKYQLYLDESRTRVWGNDEASMAGGTTGSGGSAVSLTIYGQVPAQPDVVAGGYADTIIATLYY